MVEYVRMDITGSQILFSANQGDEPKDIDRRHLGKIDLEKWGINLAYFRAGN